MALGRRWILPEVYLRADDFPTNERLVGSSLKWMCVHCGECFAWMAAYKDEKIQTWSFIHAVCSSCPGNRFSLPGSLECLTLAGWPEVPLPILLYQLECELHFLDHPHHPHNMEYSS